MTDEKIRAELKIVFGEYLICHKIVVYPGDAWRDDGAVVDNRLLLEKRAPMGWYSVIYDVYFQPGNPQREYIKLLYALEGRIPSALKVQ
jgi:hypothetical protein